jgi:hypothetical protein
VLTNSSEALAELLRTKSLSDPDVLKADSWQTVVKPVTRPLIDKIDRALGWKDGKKFGAATARTKRRYFDSLTVGRDDLYAFVAVGLADEPGGTLEHCLAWGLGAWGSEKASVVSECEAVFQARQPPGFAVRRINGVRAGDFGGITALLYKALSPTALVARSLDDLVQEIVGDLRQVRGIMDSIGPPTLTAASLSKWLLDAHGLYFPPYQIAAFVTALQAKGFVILSGISGTGKTKLAVRIAELATGKRPEVIPVRPDWRDSRSLLGYFNPITERYVSTPLLRQLLLKTERRAAPNDGDRPNVDFRLVRQRVREAGDWRNNLRTFVEAVERRDPQDLSDEDLNKIWLVANNGVTNTGQATSSQLNLTTDQLRQATAFLKAGSPGNRLISAFRYLKQQTGGNHWLRVLRALATFDLDQTCVLARKTSLEATLRFLGYDQRFSLESAVREGNHQAIDRAFAFLRVWVDDHLPEFDRYEKAIAPWYISLQAEGKATEKRETLENTQVDESGHRFVVLDEMNLARVEYYFAEFLSVLESDRDPNSGTTLQALPLHDRRAPVKDDSDDSVAIEVPPSLPLPGRLYVVGTVNTDETTHAFSPKVLDRAFSIEFADVHLAARPENADARPIPPAAGVASLLDRSWGSERTAAWAQAMGDPRFLDWLDGLNQVLRPYGFQFGYRVRDEIAHFVGFALASPLADGFRDHTADVFIGAFDAAALMKVLPKFHGPRARIAEPLVRVLSWALNPAAPDENRQRIDSGTSAAAPATLHSFFTVPSADGNNTAILRRVAEKVVCMLDEVRTTGFTSYA